MDTGKVMKNIDKGIEDGLKRAAVKSELNDGVMFDALVTILDLIRTTEEQGEEIDIKIAEHHNDVLVDIWNLAQKTVLEVRKRT